MRHAFLIVLSIFTLGILTSCGRKNEEHVKKRPDLSSVTVVLEGAATSLDPVKILDINSQYAANVIHSPLWWVERDGNLKMALAASVDMSPDGRSCQVTLQTNAFFWDQTPVTTRDVQYSFERFRRSSHVHRWILDALEGVKQFDETNSNHIAGIEIQSAHRMRFRFGYADRDFPWKIASLATAIVKADSANSEIGILDSHVIGAGPFSPKDIDPNVAYSFERNVGYPFPNRITNMVMRLVENPQLQLAGQRNGTIHVTRIRGPMLSEVSYSKTTNLVLKSEYNNSTLVRSPANELLFLSFNWNSGKFASIEPEQRKPWLNSLAESLNRQQAIDRLYLGAADPSYSIVPIRTSVSRQETSDVRDFPKITATLSVPNDPSSRAVAAYIREQANRIKIDFELEFLEPGNLVQRVLQKKFDAGVFWIELQIPSREPHAWLSFFDPASPFANFGEPIPDLTQKLAEARRIDSPLERTVVYSNLVEEVSLNQTTWLPLMSREAIFLVNQNVGNLFLDFNGTPVFGLLGIK